MVEICDTAPSSPPPPSPIPERSTIKPFLSITSRSVFTRDCFEWIRYDGGLDCQGLVWMWSTFPAMLQCQVIGPTSLYVCALPFTRCSSDIPYPDERFWMPMRPAMALLKTTWASAVWILSTASLATWGTMGRKHTASPGRYARMYM